MRRPHSVATLRKILFPPHRARDPVTTAALLTIELVDSPSGLAHRVSQETFAADRRDGGRYQALCGGLVLPASLTTPARGHCPACEPGSAPTRRRGGRRGAR